MPYKDKEQQREAIREGVRRYRALHKGITKDVIPNVIPINPVRALRCDSVEHKLEAVGLKLDGNRISLRQAQDKSLVTQPGVKPGVPSPIYDYNIHRPGDKVRVWQGDRLIEAMVPEDGIGISATVSLVSRNLSAPTFTPVPKPVPKTKTARYKHRPFRVNPSG